MSADTESCVRVGRLQGSLVEPFSREDLVGQIISALEAHDRSSSIVTRIDVSDGSKTMSLAAKKFGPQSFLKDWWDLRFGSPAHRSWNVARCFAAHELGTPEPVGYLESWARGRLREAWYFSIYYDHAVSFKDELIHYYREDPVCRKVMALLEHVAHAVRRLHDAGIYHRDLGNQNIVMRRNGDAGWDEVQFMDLNRARNINEPLGLRQRAFDISRVHLPSDLLRVFKEMYFHRRPEGGFEKWEKYYRGLKTFKGRTRTWRHPLRTRKERLTTDQGLRYPDEKEVWIWDDRSVQPVNILRRKDRKKRYPMKNYAALCKAVVTGALPVYRNYKDLLEECFQQPVAMKDRVGVAIEPTEKTLERELESLAGLGTVPVLLRFYHHQSPEAWRFGAGVLRRLKEEGHAVSAALVQDREAVTNPSSWKSFVREVLNQIHDVVEAVEVGHAFNRVKLGVWELNEYWKLADPVLTFKFKYPSIQMMGPAAIDFEYYYLMAALHDLPANQSFDALSHLLYVDRRGAPENKQGMFSTLEKAALARAIARWAKGCGEHLVVSEVNWPLQGTGVYSPVVSPYDTPGPRTNDPGVDEEDYARFMIRYLLIALCSGMVQRVYWWRLVARGFGLVDDTDPENWRERPAYHALRVFLEFLSETTFKEKVPAHEKTHHYAFGTAQDGEIAVLYAEYESKGVPPTALNGRRVVSMVGDELEAKADTIIAGPDPVYLFPPARR